MLIAELIILLLIFIIIITQRIGIRITKNNVTTVYVNFIFTAVRLGKSKKHKIKLSRTFQNRFFIKSALEYLLPKTDIEIYSFKVNNDDSLVSLIFSDLVFTTALAYVKGSARRVTYIPKNDNPIDLEISFILLHGIISLILGQYYKTKNRLLRN